jgi:hypothetical protein
MAKQKPKTTQRTRTKQTSALPKKTTANPRPGAESGQVRDAQPDSPLVTTVRIPKNLFSRLEPLMGGKHQQFIENILEQIVDDPLKYAPFESGNPGELAQHVSDVDDLLFWINHSISQRNFYAAIPLLADLRRLDAGKTKPLGKTAWNRLIYIMLNASYECEFYGIREKDKEFFDYAKECLDWGSQMCTRLLGVANNRDYSKKNLLYNKACIEALLCRQTIHRALASHGSFSDVRDVRAFDSEQFFKSLEQCWFSANVKPPIGELSADCLRAAHRHAQSSRDLLENLLAIDDNAFDSRYWRSSAWSDPDFMILRVAALSDDFDGWCHIEESSKARKREAKCLIQSLKVLEV